MADLDISKVVLTERDKKIYEWEQSRVPTQAISENVPDNMKTDLIKTVWQTFCPNNKPIPSWRYSEGDVNACWSDRGKNEIVFSSSWGKICKYVILHETTHLLVGSQGHNSQFLGALVEVYEYFLGMNRSEMIVDLQKIGIDVDENWREEKKIYWSIA